MNPVDSAGSLPDPRGVPDWQLWVETLSAGLIERDEQARCLLLAAASGEHVLLVGPPGTAKSEIARRLQWILGGPWFERLLTRFTVPEELFGPLSLAALDEARYEREIEGYLPCARVAFLDEVFKANSAILNALLTLINERAFDQGARRIPVPLATLVAASNEWPSDESLSAFVDRFTFRCRVDPVSEAGFAVLLDTPASHPGAPAQALSGAGLFACSGQAQQVCLSDPVRASLWQWRSKWGEPAGRVSDRRWVRAVHVLKVSAYTQGRGEVNLADLGTLRWVLPGDPATLDAFDDWFCEQLGAAQLLEPVRLARYAQAWEQQLQIEETASELAFDDSGKLALARGLGGADEAQLEAAAPRLSAFSRRRRYSPSHLRARLAQLDSLLREVDAWLDACRGQRQTTAQMLLSHVWLPRALVNRVLDRLDGSAHAVVQLRERLAEVREAFDALPRAEVDDGRVPSAVDPG